MRVIVHLLNMHLTSRDTLVVWVESWTVFVRILFFLFFWLE